VRIAVVTESFLPQVNGVTNSVLRVCEQLQQRGHEALVIAPGVGTDCYSGARVIRTPSLPAPGYRGFRIACPWPGLRTILRQFRPDVVHLASPFVLGAHAAFAADRLEIPAVAVYQTDLAGFAARYGVGLAEPLVWRWLRRVHGHARRTLAPSRAAVADLTRNGVERVAHWPRGVDLVRFRPDKHDPELQARLAPNGEVVVGYVGRLAHEKQLTLLAGLDRRADLRLVIVGDGPQMTQLRRHLPHAQFLGFQSGENLARTFASLDVFVHPGAHETFCQSAQEALASGVPVVGPAAGGLMDLVQPGCNGTLFEPGSIESLHSAVLDLVHDPLRRQVYARRARPSVSTRGWDVIGDDLVQHYQDVAS
jgi:phosphatidylinositol alpha 1,6-mannosyltransferase